MAWDNTWTLFFRQSPVLQNTMHIFMAPKSNVIIRKSPKSHKPAGNPVIPGLTLARGGRRANAATSRRCSELQLRAPQAFIRSAAEEPELLHKLVSFNIHD